MTMDKQEKIALFVDGANAYATGKALDISIDYESLLEMVAQSGYLVRAFYYTALHKNDNGVIFLKPLVDKLQYKGYRVVTKMAKEFRDTHTGEIKVKGNMDMELAVDVLMMAKYVDRVVIFSGDGDFKYLVEKVQDLGVKVTVLSTMITKPSMIADELRRIADEFIDVGEEKNKRNLVLRRRVA